MIQLFIRYVELSAGLLAIMPILLIAVIAVIIERLWLLKKTLSTGRRIMNRMRSIPYQDIDSIRSLAESNSKTLQGHLMITALSSRGESSDEMEYHLEEEILYALPRVTRLMWILDTAVTIAPLLGLFGTIIGMIQAFNVLSNHGGPSEVTGGIADALVSTGAGLLIAIISVYAMNYLNTLVGQVTHQLEVIKITLINRTHGGGVQQNAGGTVADLRTAAARR